MDTAQWPQEIVVKPMEEIITNTCSFSSVTATNNNNNNTNNNNNKPCSTSLERKVRPQKDQAVNCPRCNSTNTKFCYYNNYSLTQPRYFCKTCRRYWTEGGSLRNIPVGGGSRKNKRPSSSSSSSSTSLNSKKLMSSNDLVTTHDTHTQTHLITSNPNKIHNHQGQDLNLGFTPTHHHHHHQEFRSLSEFIQLPTSMETNNTPKTQTHNSTSPTTANANHHHHHPHPHPHHLSALELLNGLTSSRGLTPFMPMPIPSSDPNDNAVYSSSSGFSLQDFKPTLNFSLDGLGNGYGGGLQGSGLQEGEETNNGRLLFPFEDLKQVSSTTTTNEPNREHGDSTGYWTGMLGSGGSW